LCDASAFLQTTFACVLCSARFGAGPRPVCRPSSRRRRGLEMSSRQETAPRFSARKILIGAAVTLFIVAVAGVGVWTAACPCNGIPGLVLLGPVHNEPVTDWKFVNDVPLCQIQISTGLG